MADFKQGIMPRLTNKREIMHKMRILALDYDGVIADSALECLFVGFNAYLKINPHTSLFSGKEFTFENFENMKNKNRKIIAQYMRLRPYVIDAFCWYVILHIMENNIRVKNQNEYNRIRSRLMGAYDKYVDYFYNERYKLQKKNFSRWLRLQRPYKIAKSIKRLRKKYIITIATNNSEKSIRPFLRKYHIQVEAVADCSISISKLKQLEFIKDKHKAGFPDIYFIDDQVAHFGKLLKLGVKCFLAAWGYSSDEQRKRAEKEGVVLLNEDNFYKKLVE